MRIKQEKAYHSFIYQVFPEHTYCMLVTVLGVGDTLVNKRVKSLLDSSDLF